MNDGVFPSNERRYMNTFDTITPEICNDNKDNDDDELIDIADPDCQQYCFDFQWGSEGTGNGQFIRPHDVVFDSSGFVYVLDRSRANVQKFTPEGQFLSKFGSEDSDDGEFLEPYSMLIDPADNLYIVDKNNDRIQKLTKDGMWLFTIDGFSTPEDMFDGFSTPEDMAIDKDGNFHVTDTGADRVIKFDQNFDFISEFGSSGDGPGEFEHPHGIGVDSTGNLYVNDGFSPRI